MNSEGTLQSALITRYGPSRGSWRSRPHNYSQVPAFWKDVHSLFGIITMSIDFVVGHNSKVSSWLERWCSNIPFAKDFPNLFELTFNKGASVEEYWHREWWSLAIDGGHNVDIRRHIQ